MTDLTTPRSPLSRTRARKTQWLQVRVNDAQRAQIKRVMRARNIPTMSALVIQLVREADKRKEAVSTDPPED